MNKLKDRQKQKKEELLRKLFEFWSEKNKDKNMGIFIKKPI